MAMAQLHSGEAIGASTGGNQRPYQQQKKGGNSSNPQNRAVFIPLLPNSRPPQKTNATGTCAAQYLSLSRVPPYFPCVPGQWCLRYILDDSKISDTMLWRVDA
ncbi:hypothetical protein TcCL_Unassigned04253 [Trypanosoma cruzi]|nr:hypothetical protein TcCL_Unassigned04253 [Trypanosoma cruzi]